MLALAILGIALSLAGIGVALSGPLSTIFIGLGIIVAMVSLPVGLKKPAKPSLPSKPPKIGYLGREGSKGNLRRAKFGKGLDTAIDNAGEVDAEEAEFSAGSATE
jgi:hypothetical protein